MDYLTLTVQDRLTIARDALRGRETDYYRATLYPSDTGAQARMDSVTGDIEHLQAEIKALEDEAAADAPKRKTK